MLGDHRGHTLVAIEEAHSAATSCAADFIDSSRRVRDSMLLRLGEVGLQIDALMAARADREAEIQRACQAIAERLSATCRGHLLTLQGYRSQLLDAVQLADGDISAAKGLTLLPAATFLAHRGAVRDAIDAATAAVGFPRPPFAVLPPAAEGGGGDPGGPTDQVTIAAAAHARLLYTSPRPRVS